MSANSKFRIINVFFFSFFYLFVLSRIFVIKKETANDIFAGRARTIGGHITVSPYLYYYNNFALNSVFLLFGFIFII